MPARHACRRRVVLVAVVLLSIGACGSDDQEPSASSAPATEPVDTAVVPTIPPGGRDCGTRNLMSGWPTTSAPSPDGYACITGALAAGTPARMVLISVGQASSGRETSDGYELPTRRVVTWVVLGKAEVQQTTDLSDDGGTVTTLRCTGLAVTTGDSTLAGTGCAKE